MAEDEESNPLLPKQEPEAETKHEIKTETNKKHEMKSPPPEIDKKHVTKPRPPKNVGGPSPPSAAVPIGWTAEGLPVREQMTQRSEWESGIFSCLRKSDEFYGSDLEVCLLGSIAPCVLHGSNAERLGSDPGSFATHCLPYTGLYLIGNCFFGWNCLAPWFSYPTRTAIRHKFNLEGNCEALARSCGCDTGLLMDEARREQCESSYDFATHVFCHSCALCQEARELRRRLPHPGFTAQPVLVMIPPGGQTMGRGA